jgi:hypothetical protein
MSNEDNYQLIKNLKITTITVDSKINNFNFNEKELTDEFRENLKKTCDEHIIKFSSNYLNPPITYNSTTPQEELINSDNDDNISLIIEEESVNEPKKRGRKKKNKNKFLVIPRKKQGNGTNFNSQITITIKSFKNPDKNYNIKLFRTGSIGIPGITDLEDVKFCLDYLVEKLKKNFDSNIELLSFKSNMINFKTFFIKDDNKIIKLKKLVQLLNENNSDILHIPIFISEEKNNSISIRFKNDPEYTVKKDFLVEIFLSGKINIKGVYPLEFMKERLKIIENYLFNPIYSIIIDKLDNKKEILDIIANCRDDIIED